MTISAVKRYTPEEYFQIEETATDKHEYLDGELILMSGGSANHNQIAGNFYRNFPLNIDNVDYYIYISDLRLAIPDYRLYTYPDIMIVRGKPIYDRGRKDTIVNPLIILEILSRSTRGYDSGDKFQYYRSIPNFQEYILIDQYSYHAEQFYKQDDSSWLFREYKGGEAILTLQSINFKINFQDLYQRVDFDSDER